MDKYTYTISADLITEIISDAGTDAALVVDRSGPWESNEAADTWAQAFTKKLNDGDIKPDEVSIEVANS